MDAEHTLFAARACTMQRARIMLHGYISRNDDGGAVSSDARSEVNC